MNKEFHGVSLEEMCDLWEKIRIGRLAVEYIAGTVNDNRIMANLDLIAYGIQGTENVIARMIGQEPDLTDHDMPY